MEVPELHAGDLGAIAKLKETVTGDTLGDKGAPIYYPAARHSRAFHHLCHRAQNARRRGPHRPGHSQDSGGGPGAALFARSADQGVSAGGIGPAAHRGGGGQAAQALPRGRDAETSEGALPRDHPRQSRCRRQAQEADRRARPVRRVPRAHGAAAPRARDSSSWTIFSAAPFPRTRFLRWRRASAPPPSAAIWPASRWWISGRSFMTASTMTWTPRTWPSRSPARWRSRRP